MYLDDNDDYVYVDRADRVDQTKRRSHLARRIECRLSQLDHVQAARVSPSIETGTSVLSPSSSLHGTHSLDLRRAALTSTPHQTCCLIEFEQVPSMPLNRSNALDEGGLLSSARTSGLSPCPLNARIVLREASGRLMRELLEMNSVSETPKEISAAAIAEWFQTCSY